MIEAILHVFLLIVLWPILLAGFVGVSPDMMFVAVILNIIWMGFLTVCLNKS